MTVANKLFFNAPTPIYICPLIGNSILTICRNFLYKLRCCISVESSWE